LLPKNQKTRKVLERNELHFYGVVPTPLQSVPYSVEKINKSNVRKIVSGNDHCLILFTNGELVGFGSNALGQLGLKITKENAELTDLKLLKPIIPSVNSYEVVDISAGENFSFLLIRVNGKNMLCRLGMRNEDKYNDDFENIEIIVKIYFNVTFIRLLSLPLIMNLLISRIYTHLELEAFLLLTII